MNEELRKQMEIARELLKGHSMMEVVKGGADSEVTNKEKFDLRKLNEGLIKQR